MPENQYAVKVTYPSGRQYTFDIFRYNEEDAVKDKLAIAYEDALFFGKSAEEQMEIIRGFPGGWERKPEKRWPILEKMATAEGYTAEIVPWEPS